MPVIGDFLYLIQNVIWKNNSNSINKKYFFAGKLIKKGVDMRIVIIISFTIIFFLFSFFLTYAQDNDFKKTERDSIDINGKTYVFLIREINYEGLYYNSEIGILAKSMGLFLEANNTVKKNKTEADITLLESENGDPIALIYFKEYENNSPSVFLVSYQEIFLNGEPEIIGYSNFGYVIIKAFKHSCPKAKSLFIKEADFDIVSIFLESKEFSTEESKTQDITRLIKIK
jgi:hypothetical protein